VVFDARLRIFSFVAGATIAVAELMYDITVNSSSDSLLLAVDNVVDNAIWQAEPNGPTRESEK